MVTPRGGDSQAAALRLSTVNRSAAAALTIAGQLHTAHRGAMASAAAAAGGFVHDDVEEDDIDSDGEDDQSGERLSLSRSTAQPPPLPTGTCR